MNAKQLSEALIQSRHFEPMIGMSVRADGVRMIFVGMHEGVQHYSAMAGWEPPDNMEEGDGEICFDDPATVGCLLKMVQNAYKNSGIQVVWHGTHGYSVAGTHGSRARTTSQKRFPIAGVALAHALLAAP